MRRVEIYSDGAAMNNGASGAIGYAAVLLVGGKTAFRSEHYGSEWGEPANSIRAEYLGAELGLRQTDPESRRETHVLLFADCEPVVKVLAGEFQAGEHQELAREIRAVLRQFQKAEVKWIRGHCGHRFNERAHTLAYTAARKLHEVHRPCLTRKTSFANLRAGQKPLLTTPVSPACSLGAKIRDLSQARLNRIANPSSAHHDALMKWTIRFANRQEWTDERLTERLEALMGEYVSLRFKVLEPPEEWDGVKWTRMSDRLMGWLGQMDAAEAELAKREKTQTNSPSGGSPSAFGLKGIRERERCRVG